MNEWMNDALIIAVNPKRFTIMCVCVWGGGVIWMMRLLPHDNRASALTTPNYRWRGERIIVMNILLNKYFCCTVFKKIQTFILTGCREYLYISVCIWYEDSFTQMKRWNAHKVTLRAVLDRDAPIDRPVIRIVRFRTCPARIGDRPGQSHVLPIPEK